ncbi:AMP-binding protein [Saccharopolyspora pogona]|uniref:AMP-binding protein n=1 Tax=Saccharopolyspora pogona TaxID=333966 RepID=UPI001CC25FE3|nr:AMP-binding protein [Saccharopolyspora pogona]
MGKHGQWAEVLSIGDLLVRSATRYPGRDALVFPDKAAELGMARRVRVWDVAATLHTSGTTANPKGCMLSHKAMTRGPVERAYKDPQQTSESFDADRCLHSGDLYGWTDEGQVVFQGRLKDMLKIGGENVAAIEIEPFLAPHPAVECVEVVGARRRVPGRGAGRVRRGAHRARRLRDRAHRVVPGKDRPLQDSAGSPVHRAW